MLMLSPRHVAGFSLIELMIGLVVLGIVLMIGLPSLATWMQNTQVRTSAEAIVSGLQLARAEALRRNRTVQFSLVDSLSASCTVSTSGTNWVVSLVDPAGACDAAPSETTAPQIVQKRSGQEGSPNVALAASGGSSVLFNGLGRLSTATGVPAAFTQITVSNPGGGACQSAAGPIRCLSVTISSSGAVRMCDPAVTSAADPRYC
jgi:type IV fimbrial biogenesis protein FimT